MYAQIFHLQNLSALHVGTGQDVGVVDLPISRAKATNLPIVAGSAIKGVLRDELATQDGLTPQDIKTLFGPNNQLDNAHAGAIAFGDAHLLLLPIRSFAGTLAYATCPYILRQYQRDNGLGLSIPSLTDRAMVAQGSVLYVNKQSIALEDLDIQAEQSVEAQAWAMQITKLLYPNTVLDAASWREEVGKRFIILPDNLFSFLADTATEIRTRIRIDRDTRIVKEGALWTEENLPAETVLWGVLGVSQSRNSHDKDKRNASELASLLPKDEIMIQIGGKHTVGRGLCRLLINDCHSAGSQAKNAQS